MANKSKWSEEQDDLLISLVNKHGKTWTKISKYFNNKNCDQCRCRYRSIDPSIKKGRWSIEEDSELLQALFSNIEVNIESLSGSFEKRIKRDILGRINQYKLNLMDKY